MERRKAENKAELERQRALERQLLAEQPVQHVK
jgi:hypothetical protein